MSLVFSDTTNKNGIIQHLERTLGFNDGDISGNTTRLAQFTSDVNLALDSAFTIIFKAGGTWNFDDSNHTDYPIVTTNLVASQQDYSFTSDSNSNLILEIQKVMAKTSTGDYQTLTPADQQELGTDQDSYSLSTEGNPTHYDKTANGIFLRPIPSTNVTNGLKVYINREASYFTVSDTTKKPGIAGIFHKYLVIHAADNYSLINNLKNRQSLQEEKLLMERDISDWYGRRTRDEKPQMVANVTDTR